MDWFLYFFLLFSDREPRFSGKVAIIIAILCYGLVFGFTAWLIWYAFNK